MTTDTKTHTAALPKGAIGLAKIAGDAVRYALSGIQIKRTEDRVTLTVTNGHSLVEASYPQDETDFTWEAIIPAKWLAAAVRSFKLRASDTFTVEDTLDGLLTVSGGLVDARTPKELGTYPKTDGVIPEASKSLGYVALNASLLPKTLEAMREASGHVPKDTCGILFSGGEDSKGAVRLEVHNPVCDGAEVIGCIMPVSLL